MDRLDRLLGDLRRDRSEPSPPPPDRIGKYSVLKELHRTGSSVVYLAQDPDLARHVAIKVLGQDRSVPEFIHRFQREGTLTAALRHPNIITIYDTGVWPSGAGGPVPYLVMDFVEGGTLSGKRLGSKEAAGLMVQVAEAVHHAHAAGIIHRDLKPENVLLDSRGRPVVSDFGLAKLTQLSSIATQEGLLLGTPQYMAPEQIEGDSSQVGPRTDVYALGAILYELVAGGPPHRAETTAALFHKILREEPPSISLLAGEADSALGAVILKALDKNPAYRYATALEMAEDLRRFLEGRPLRAATATRVRRLWLRVVRRNGVVWGVSAALLIAASWILWSVLAAVERKSKSEEALAAAQAWQESGDPERAAGAFRVALSLGSSDTRARRGLDEAERASRESDADNGGTAGSSASPSSWIELGGSASGGGVSRNAGVSVHVSLELDPEGRPALCWRDNSSGIYQAYLRKWNGAAWEELGGSASGGSLSASRVGARYPAMALDPDGKPIVAWEEELPGRGQVYLRRWNRQAWAELGGSASRGGVSNSSAEATVPALAVDAAGNPVVAWQDSSSGTFQIYVKKWDGSRWIELGGSATGAGISRGNSLSSTPSLALDSSGRPSVAWLNREGDAWRICFRRWTGENWEALGGLEVSGRTSANGPWGWLIDRPSLALDREGRPFVAWRHWDQEGSHVYLKAWDGGAWVELGHSSSGQGIDRSLGLSGSVSLRVDPSGRPVVAWLNDTYGNVYLRRWDGARWVDLGGSGSSGGISSSVGKAGDPSVALDRLGTPAVAWSVNPAGPDEIFFRRYLPEAPFLLSQSQGGGATPLPRGSRTPDPAVVLSARVRSRVEAVRVRLQAEVVSAAEPFKGIPLFESDWVKPSAVASLQIRGLAPGPWRWQARIVDSLGMASEWVAFSRGTAAGTDWVFQPR